MPAVETEKPNSSVTENEANQTVEKNQVDIHVAPNQEVVEDESEQLEEIPAVETEKPNSSVTENEANQTAEKHQVDIHVAPNQEVITDEPKKVKDVQHPQFEKAKPIASEKKKSEKADVQTLGTKTNTSKSSTVTHSEKVEKQSGNTLPKTGEDKGLISVFTGFFLLFLSFVAFSLRRDRQA